MIRAVMDNPLMRGDEAEYHWTLTGTITGPGGTGPRIRISGLESGTGHDGLIASSQGHFELAEYRKRLVNRSS